MAGRRNRERPKELFWRKALERQRASGQTQRQFCESEHLNEGTFSWWRREIAKLDREKGTTQAFVPVFTGEAGNAPRQGSGAVAEIDLDKRVLRIFSGVDADTLRSILEALRG